jgi:hypothetical protein
MITFDHFPMYALPSTIYITPNNTGLLLGETRMSGVQFNCIFTLKSYKLQIIRGMSEGEILIAFSLAS